MAEIAVNLLMDKLISLLRDEINLLSKVHGQVMSVTEELQLIRAYLKDADTKAETEETNNLLKEWVTQMRQVSFRLEDVTDKYLLKMAKHTPRTRGAAGVLCRICDLFRTVKPWHEISSQIGEITESLERLNKARETYGFNPSSPESSSASGEEISTRHYLWLGAHFIEDDQLVGVEHVKQVLTGWLFEGESVRTVISVVGEGGQGKTTIVNKLYTEQRKERSFDCYAWVTVSRSVSGEHVLQTLIQSFHEGVSNKNVTKEISEMDNNCLIRKLRAYLQGMNYMVVFDDVWETGFWGGVEFALPKDKGRIIITTRDRRVAEFCGSYGPIHIHDMEPLNLDDAWNLFCLKAFPEGCPENLMRLSEDFVAKCKGVPLAIVAIAGLLSTKNKNVLEWHRVYDSLRSKLSSDPHLSSFHQVLSESYHDLGYHLKLCLLYFGLFPEDSSISCVRLINLWIAEGFIEDKENEGQTLEEVAEEYLAELVARNLVKVAEVYPYGRVRSCRVHDLMHDFILKKCEELNFCHVKKSDGFKFHEWTRRLSIDMKIIEEATVKRSSANYGLVRTCLMFSIQQMPTTLVESLFSSFKLLIRLDCENVPLDYLPKAVGSLFNLKYLNLRNTNIKKIPKFIGKLQKLETLDLKGTQVSDLPQEINQLSKLRHLLAYSYYNIQVSVKLKQGIGHLTALQKLSKVDASDDGAGVIGEMKNLKQMRRLGIKNLTREDGKQLCSAIVNMMHLSALSITSAKLYDNEVLDLESLTDPPRHLQRLYLAGCLEKLPCWILKLKNLVRLTLCHSGLREDPLPLLKDLPELLELELSKSYKGTELHFKEGWFMKLKTLQLCGMSLLRALKVDEEALPNLQFLGMNPRPQTVEVPAHVLEVMLC